MKCQKVRILLCQGDRFRKWMICQEWETAGKLEYLKGGKSYIQRDYTENTNIE